MLTAEHIREILDYRCESGVFFWKVKRSRATIGARAGSIDKQAGYEQIGIDGKLYRSHRLAWLYVYGAWPAEQIDHINGCRDDNRIKNLRAVASCTNNQNRRAANKNNGSHLLGAYLDKRDGRYFSSIMIGRKAIHIGYFDTAEAAHAAHVLKRRELFAGNTL